jgi:hypothetical protein
LVTIASRSPRTRPRRSSVSAASQVAYLSNAQDAGSPQGILEDLVAAGQRSGVGSGRAQAFRGAPGLERNDRLVARGGA